MYKEGCCTICRANFLKRRYLTKKIENKFFCSYEELRNRSECNSPIHKYFGEMYNCEHSNGQPLATSSNHDEQQEAKALKKALEWELSLDTRELRSHAWYHGTLSRHRAEEILLHEGDFLVRDCASQPDNYVLSCCSKAAVLHFVLNKIILQPHTVYERVQYQFEEDAFDAVPDLITCYVGSGKPISAASGAIIQFPCNRAYPLSFYGHKIVGNQLHTQMLAGQRASSPQDNRSIACSGQAATPNTLLTASNTRNSPPNIRRDVPPTPSLPTKQQRSQSLTPLKAIVVYNMNKDASLHGSELSRSYTKFEQFPQELAECKMHGNGFQTIARCNPTIELRQQAISKFTTHSLPRSTPAGHALRQRAAVGISSLARNASLDAPTTVGQLVEVPEQPPSPPPKPGRRVVLGESSPRGGVILSHQASGSDSGNGSGESTLGDTNDGIIQRGVIIKNPHYMSSSESHSTLKRLTNFDAIAAEDQLFSEGMDDFKFCSKFDFENFSTLLLPSVENKPLDGDALNTFKIMLLETGPKLIAEHITRVDIALFLEPYESFSENEQDRYMDYTGLELLTLPNGRIFRNDIIERTQCLKSMVAVTILTCQTDFDRAELLSKWIQIAVETKTALGNLYGFCAVMLGLCMSQVQQLDQAWHILRQKYTDSAFTFEAKLRPTLISMNECSNPQAPNTTIPHVLLYALLIDRPVWDIINHAKISERPVLYLTCISPWETKADDFGMSINYHHLDASRGFLKNLDLYRKNAKIILEEASSRADELLNDAFRTEFHVKFLWGSSGASAKPEDRHNKLEKVLSLMTDKFCRMHV